MKDSNCTAAEREEGLQDHCHPTITVNPMSNIPHKVRQQTSTKNNTKKKPKMDYSVVSNNRLKTL